MGGIYSLILYSLSLSLSLILLFGPSSFPFLLRSFLFDHRIFLTSFCRLLRYDLYFSLSLSLFLYLVLYSSPLFNTNVRKRMLTWACSESN